MKAQIEAIITEAVASLNEELQDPSLKHITEETRLFGAKSALDSLALVSLITDVEELVYEQLDKEIVLADERAMSQKTSPFRSVGSLRDYILELLK
jgi:acyl carrier protein